MGTTALISLKDVLTIGGVDPSRGLRSQFTSDQLAGGLRRLVSFPENQVEIFRDYFPDDFRRFLDEMLQGLNTIGTGFPDHVENSGDVDLARRVVNARSTLGLFLSHPSLRATQEHLAKIASGFKTRSLGLAKVELERLATLDTQVPVIDEDLIGTALHPDDLHIVAFERGSSSPGDPPDDQNEVRVNVTIRGYAGPQPNGQQLSQLLGCFLLLSGTRNAGEDDRTFRLGLLKAECEVGLATSPQELRRAIASYDPLLADAKEFRPEQVKAVAIRAGFAHLALAEWLFYQRDDANAPRAASAEYDQATAVLGANGVSPLNPLRRRIDATVEAQRLKLDAGLNVFGLKDSYVPVQTARGLLPLVLNRIDDAEKAVGQFIEFRREAERLKGEAAQQVLDEQIGGLSTDIAKERIAIATAQRTVVSERVTAIQDQLDRLGRDSILSGLGGALVSVGSIVAGAAATGLTGGAAAGIGMVVAGAGVSSAVSYAARGEDLENQLHIAKTELEIADRQERTAKLEKAIDELRRKFAADRLEDLTGRLINADVAYQLVNIFQDLAETNLAVAVQLAYLYERAVSFARLKAGLNKVKFDYRIPAPGFAGTIPAPLALKTDVSRVSEQDNDDQITQLLDENPISLATSYPLEFARFQQTGTMDFVISLYDLDKRRRGVEKRRLRQVIVEPIGTIPATGFAGHITHHGFFLLRDKESTMQASRLVPTEAEFAAAFAGLQTGKTQGDPIGGVIPYLLDKDRQDLSAQPPVDQNNPEPTARALFQNRGETGRWTLEIDGIDTRRIVDVLLSFRIVIPEGDDELQRKVEELLAAYEQELAAGDLLDRTAAVSLRHRFRDAFEQLETEPATFSFTDRDVPLTDSDFPAKITDLKVKAIVIQALDTNKTGVEGVTFEVRNQASGFTLTKTTGPSGFTEALDARIPVVPREQRVALLGTWQLALPDPRQFERLDDVQLFFLYEFRPAPTH